MSLPRRVGLNAAIRYTDNLELGNTGCVIKRRLERSVESQARIGDFNEQQDVVDSGRRVNIVVIAMLEHNQVRLRQRGQGNLDWILYLNQLSLAYAAANQSIDSSQYA